MWDFSPRRCLCLLHRNSCDPEEILIAFLQTRAPGTDTHRFVRAVEEQWLRAAACGGRATGEDGSQLAILSASRTGAASERSGASWAGLGGTHLSVCPRALGIPLTPTSLPRRGARGTARDLLENSKEQLFGVSAEPHGAL